MALIETLNNIKNNVKPSIKTSLENKSVSVEDDYKLEEVPSLIDSIPSGGGEEVQLNDWSYLCYFGNTNYSMTQNKVDCFEKCYKNLGKPLNAMYLFCASGNITLYNNTLIKIINIVNDIDFSNCTSVSNFFGSIDVTTSIEDEYNLYLDLQKCTTLQYFSHGYFGTDINLKKIELNTPICNNFTQAFYSGFNGTSTLYQRQYETIKLNMDKCTACTYFLCGSGTSPSNVPNLKHLLIDGSFGGNSTTSTLTLDLHQSDIGLGHDGFVEMFEYVGTNTKGNTRIFNIPSAVYDTLTEDEIAIATSKGYTITSA